jgi:hypothetical protein
MVCVKAHIAQAVEHFLGKEEVVGSSPVVGTMQLSTFERGRFSNGEAKI